METVDLGGSFVSEPAVDPIKIGAAVVRDTGHEALIEPNHQVALDASSRVSEEPDPGWYDPLTGL
jgi:hypothetical protein